MAMDAQTTSTYTVTGRITTAQGGPAGGMTVRAFQRDSGSAERQVGPAAVTDTDGRYVINFAGDGDHLHATGIPGSSGGGGGDQRSVLFIRVFDGDEKVGQSDPKQVDDHRITIDLQLPDLGPVFRVFGTVRDQFGDPLDAVTVQAVDRDMRSEEPLGATVTSAGQYEVRYRSSRFRKSEKDSADLVLKVVDQQGAEMYRTPIQYNAPADFLFDITVGGAVYAGPSEWDVLTGTITPLLDGVPPTDLREDDQFQDITFLTGETGQSRLTIGTWLASLRLADKTAQENTPLSAEVFFGYLRQGQPSIFSDSLLADMQHDDRRALLREKLLRALAELDPTLQRSLLEKAVADNLIPARIAPTIPAVLQTLAQIKLRYAADVTFGGGKGTIGQLLDLTPEAKQQQAAFLAAFSAHTGPLSTFWKQLEESGVLSPPAVAQVKVSFELGALTNNHVPLVGHLLGQFQQSQLKAPRELAKLQRSDWKAVFAQPGPDGKPIGVPANIDGDTEDARREQYAADLDQQFERAFPTTSFAAKLANAGQTAVAAKSDLVRFLDNNPDFQIERFRVEHYVAENPDALHGIEDKDAMLSDLKSVQRVFKLQPTHRAVNALLTRDIDSAQQIYFMGRGQFVAALAGSGTDTATKALADTEINKLDAARMYQKAESTYAMALAVFADYNLAVNGARPFGVPAPVQVQTAQALAATATLPSLQTLFGSLDFCECASCRSVYSPAAYFVDVLRFLGDRGTQGKSVNTGKSVRQVLLERRPDLGEIELSCENTETVLPYIDLVNEILEDMVAPPFAVTLDGAIEPDLVAGPARPSVLAELAAKGVAIGADAQVYAPDIRGRWAIREAQHAYKLFKVGGELQILPTRQTLLSAAELRANPEYTNDDAYLRLKYEVFPLDLPFDLWSTEVRTYLDHLGVPQARLLELFQQRSSNDATLIPTELQIDCAWLGMTDKRRQIITDTLPEVQPWDFWGLAEDGNNIPNPDNPADPTANLTGTWIDVLSHVAVLLHRDRIEYSELLQLLDMRYVNADGLLSILEGGDPNAANCDTSRFTVANLSVDALSRIHRFLRLWRVLGCTMWELDALLPAIMPTVDTSGKVITDDVLQDISRMNRVRTQTGLDWPVVNSLYRGIDNDSYVDRGREGAPAVQSLYQRLLRNKLVDAVANFPADPNQITGSIADQVPGILAAFRIKESDLSLILADLGLVPPDDLDLSVLSRIHRVPTLARAIGMSVDAFLRLARLWAQDPFAEAAATLAFLELAGQVSASSFSVPELDYLLAHRFTAQSTVALDDKTVVAVLQAVRDGLQRISDDVRRKTEETPEVYVRSRLGLLPALQKDADQAVALSIIDGSWQGIEAARGAFIDAFFAHVLDPTMARARVGPLPGGLSPADRQAAVDARFGFVQPALETFLLQTQKETFVRQKVAEALRLDVPSASALLTGLHLQGSSDNLLQTINDGRLLERLADGAYRFSLAEASFPAIFKALRLLHKDALMIGKLRLEAADVAWWLEGTHATGMDWMHPRDFPTDTTSTVLVARWTAMQQFFTWKDGLPASDLTAFDFATRLLDSATPSADNVTDLVRLTGWAEKDVDDLARAFHWVDPATGFEVIKQRLAEPANLVRLAECMRILHRLGVNAVRAVQWANADPSAADAESLKQTVKARYDLGQWQQVMQPIQDTFREHKRQALVSWLVAHPDQARGQNWSDSNGLYSYFLIDVEMSACMLTSRLKQAAASAQLFVQRCLLNLEVDILAKTDLDPKWNQWKWMKNYRVWEANRKVFLYPENWIEPELRDEKSPLFQDLEQELLQNDITTDTAEQAYLNYLEKLDKVANLEIRAMYHETTSRSGSVLHVFGRTRSSQSPEYYYRRRINGARWTPWEKVEPDITGNHLVAGIHNRRLYLLWPQFLGKAYEPTHSVTPKADSSTTIASPSRYWDIQLFWSELKKGKWTPKVLSDASFRLNHGTAGGDNVPNVDFRVRLGPQIQTRLYVASDPARYAPAGLFEFEKIGKQVSLRDAATLEHLISPAESQFFNNLIRHNTASQYFYYSSIEETGKPHLFGAHDNAVAIRLLRQVVPRLTYSVIDSQARGFAGDGTFFVWDPYRTYCVDYSWRTDYSYFSRAWHARQISSFAFAPHYHPFVELFIKELNIWGIKGLLNRRIQVEPQTVPGRPPLFDFATYLPESCVVRPLPVEDVDFKYGGYAAYNWELFFHVPFFIANKLSTNQRFAEALEWFHYIFDPTSTDNATADLDTPQQKFWITKPFYETTRAVYYQQKIENIMRAIAKGDAVLRAQVNEWRDNPFNPHLIARMRTVAYQKNVLIKYIQTLIAWGDQLFSQDTIESINEATQLYVLADSVLGPRPKSVPRNVPNPVKTFYQLQRDGLDDFGNALKAVENLLPDVSPSGAPNGNGPELPRLDVLYFPIPHNEKLLTLWDTVADRLFKIRHCMNLEGVVRQLPLFEPPIDPALLVKAAAAQLDIGAVLGDLNAPLPQYRFTFMIARALEICAEVRALGAAMLSALERRDAEAFAVLRSNHEQIIHNQVRLIKIVQIDEAQRMKEALDESKKVVEERRSYHEQLVRNGLNGWEEASLVMTGGAIIGEIVATVLNALGAGSSLIPEVTAGAAGFGGSPFVTVSLGGQQVSGGLGHAAEVARGIAGVLQLGAGMTWTIGSHNRRLEDWRFQQRLAEKELPQINKQVVAAEIRHQIATQDLVNQNQIIENAQRENDFLRTKFTNRELYDWMVNQLSTVYFQCYQLGYEIAKRAERSFRYELGLSDSNYIQFGYWDSLKKGLLAGERLYYDLKRLEAAYAEQDRREYELTKHVSLAQLDPVALLKLRQNGECLVDIPETMFDLDYPGHYFRRLSSVGLSVPCTVGPYTTVACTLTLISNRLRKNSTLLAGKYARDTGGEDPRFRDEIASIQSIATSTGQRDRGLFEFSFRDQRYRPFEGAGAISTWHIKLNRELPQIDFSTIADVILHLDYTAREGGDLLRAKAADELNAKLNELALAENRHGLFRVFDLKREYPDKWYRFLHPANPADEQAFVLDDLGDRLPYFTRGFATKKARYVQIVGQFKDSATYKARLSPLGQTPADLLVLDPDPTYQGLHMVAKDLTGSEIDLGTWTLAVQADGAADFRSLPPNSVQELFLVVNYTIA
jgi:hypothetical protein